MNLEIVTVCHQYAGELAETLPMNLSQCDRMVVVTSPEDLETQRICDFHSVDVVLTDVLQARWGEFAKAKGINAGLHHLKMDGWVLHLDADIALPPRTRVTLDHADPDRSWIFGADRLRVPSYEAWRAFKTMPTIQHDGYHVRFDEFAIMPRFNAWHLGGYAPPGYFQLWHPYTSGVYSYPDEHINGDKTDILFSSLWPQQKRGLWPTIAVYHLESELAEQGTNWGGRKTKRFGPEPQLSSKQPLVLRTPIPFNHHHDRSDDRHHRRHQRPRNVVIPSIELPPSYENRPHVGEKITADPGEWIGKPPIKFSCSWRRGMTPGAAQEFEAIPGAIGFDYVVQRADADHELLVRVEAKNEHGSEFARSDATKVV